MELLIWTAKEGEKKREEKISSNSYYHITLNGNSRKQHISYKLISFSSLLLLFQLCFIGPIFKYPLDLSDEAYSSLSNYQQQIFDHFIMFWTFLLSFLFFIKPSFSFDINGKNIINKLSEVFMHEIKIEYIYVYPKQFLFFVSFYLSTT